MSAACLELPERLQAAGRLATHPVLADTVRRRVFDTVGAIALGADVEASAVLSGLLEASRCGSVVADVLQLCATGRSTEVDDIDRRSCTTPGSVAVPVALALGADRGLPGDRVLAGVLAGYEAMVTLGDTVDGARLLARGVWPSYLLAPLAAAATASQVLELTADQTTHALAIAATRASGAAGSIRDEPTSRWWTYGCAAVDGVGAALAAEAGMRGDPDALEVVLVAARAVQLDGSRLARETDGPLGIERIDTKPFCTSRQVLAAVEAARLAHESLGRPPLALVEVAVPDAYARMLDQPRPAGRLSSITSAQFQIAAALAHESALFDVARRHLELPEQARAIMRVTRVVVDEELTSLYPEVWPARVLLRSADGREAARAVHDPLGAAERPLGWDAIEEKYVRLGLGREYLGRVRELCEELGSDTPSAARELLELAKNVAVKEKT